MVETVEEETVRHPEEVSRYARRRELEKRNKKSGYRQKVLIVLIGVLALIGTAICSIWLTFRNIRATHSSFLVVQKITEFTNDFTDLSGLGFIGGFTETDPQRYYDALVTAIEVQNESFDQLEKEFRHHKRLAPVLRETNKEFETMAEAFDAVLTFQLEVGNQALAINNSTQMSFDNYVTIWDYVVAKEGTPRYRAFNKAILDFLGACKKISTRGQSITVLIVISVEICLFILLFILLWLVKKISLEANSEIRHQEKLVRQQSHEMRSKYAVAIYQMELFLDTVRREDASLDDYKAMEEEMSLALLALREVETQHRTRLDLYKIMRNTYALRPEIINVMMLMRERLDIEKAILHATQKKNQQQQQQQEFVDFILKVGDGSVNYELEGGAVNVKCDTYVLNHLLQNLLSNARKHCYQGTIILTFSLDNSNNLLRFSVRDTGTGVPPHVAQNLFKRGARLACGDSRSTGLGLASCSVFCKAAGGWIRLQDTQQQDDAGNYGYTHFEFAISGEIIRIDQPNTSLQQEEIILSAQNTSVRELEDNKQKMLLPSTVTKAPDDIAIVIVDDSTLIQSCLLRSLKRIQKELGATWNFDGVFETIESSMPYIRRMHQSNTKAIIVLDEQLASKGGVLTGIQGTRWLLKDLRYHNAIIISASGDDEIGTEHLALGASLNWGKPLPKYDLMLEDIRNVFAEKGWLQVSPSASS